MREWPIPMARYATRYWARNTAWLPLRFHFLTTRRRMLWSSDTHFVEIDLRRGGRRPVLPQLPPCEYYALVSRTGPNPRSIDFWPLSLRDRLPVIPIPLTYPDPPVPLDLQEVLNRTYDAAGYGKYIYLETPEPPLRPEDTAWAQQFLPARN